LFFPFFLLFWGEDFYIRKKEANRLDSYLADVWFT
jgi:hypothetical protein